MLKHINGSLLTEPENMLICHAFFHCELFPWFIVFADCEILNFVDCWQVTVYSHCVTEWMTTNLPAVSRTAWYCCSCYIFI